MAALNPGQRFWRTIVVRSRESKPFFFAFIGVCVALPWAVAEGFLWVSNYNQTRLQEKLLRRPSAESMKVTAINNQRLQELLDDVRLGRNIDDRYAAALRGEIMTGRPESRVIERGGTSMKPQSQAQQQQPQQPQQPASDRVPVS